MGSVNSEHSGSMNSEEFTNFIGLNYAIPLPYVQHHHEPEADYVMGEPLSPQAQQRMREQINLILNEGTEVLNSGPAAEASSKSSHVPPITSHEEVKSTSQKTILNNFQDDMHPVVHLEEGEMANEKQEKGDATKTQEPQPPTWSSIVKKNVVNEEPEVGNAEITYNNDGTATVKFPDDFFVKAQKQWDTSIIGYFIGGSFAFKYIREQAHRFWKNRGLTGVYYNTKGYYTFRFGTLEEKERALSLNTIQIGKKTMFLLPWTDGTNFKRNVIDRVPCWIRLVDVPEIFWFKEGLSSIASSVGKPLKFDAATSRFEPLKYAGIQVELLYSALRPDFIRVPLPNSSGEAKIEIQYGELPYSCSLCQAFGHSLARCNNNPERVSKRPKRNDNKKQSDGPSGSSTFPVSPTKSDYLTNMEMVPYTVGKLFGCDVVMDEDVILNELDKELENKSVKLQADTNNLELDQGEDNLEEFDRYPSPTPLAVVNVNVPHPELVIDFTEMGYDFNGNQKNRSKSPVATRGGKAHTTFSRKKTNSESGSTPLVTGNGFEALSDLPDDNHVLQAVNSPEKRRIVNSSTQVSNRKSSRLAGTPTFLSSLS